MSEHMSLTEIAEHVKRQIIEDEWIRKPEDAFAAIESALERAYLRGRKEERWEHEPDGSPTPDDCSRPWTMLDLRNWVDAHEHVPGDREVSGTLPEFPKEWARGNPFYTNTLFGLYVHTDDLDEDGDG